MTEFEASKTVVPGDLTNILSDLTNEVLKAQPDDIYLFCENYFNRKLADRKSAQSESQEVDNVTDAFAESHVTNGEGHDDDAGEGGDDFLSSDEDEEEEEATAPPPPSYTNRGRRTSVSAESMAPSSTESGSAPAKIVIPKSEEQRRRIEASIRNNFLFKNLDEEQYNDVVDAMSEKRCGPEETVIRQGAVGDFFYVTESGTLDVYVSRSGGVEPVKVTSYGANASFGELALMYNAPRAATIVTTSDCVLWALDRVTFRRILMDSTSRKRRYYESLLEDVPLLCSLEPYERHKIADALETVTYEDGQVVIRQGDIGDNFYFIESGDARVTVTDEGGSLYELKGLTKGNYFGELALLHDRPRVATVSAKGKLKVATLGKKAFVRLLGPVVDIIKRNEANYETIQKRVDAQNSGPGSSSKSHA